jgi:hypothetical protein
MNHEAHEGHEVIFIKFKARAIMEHVLIHHFSLNNCYYVTFVLFVNFVVNNPG